MVAVEVFSILASSAGLLGCIFVPNYNLKNYQLVLALVFAIEEINRNPHILPNMSLGFDLYNISYFEWNVLETSFFWLLGLEKMIPNYTCRRESKSVAVLMGASWKISYQIGPFLELYKFPQLTFGPFDHKLSDPVQFPSLYQMAPKDTSLALGMVSLLLHFHWTWVGLLISEDHKGIQILSDLRAEMEQNGVCAAFVEMIPENHVFNHHLVTESSANNCPLNASLEWLPESTFDTAMSEESYNVYNAVYAVAHTFHELHPFLKKIKFENPAGEQVNLDEKMKMEGEYDIQNFWNFPEGLGRKVKVGKFSPHAPRGQQLSLHEDLIQWSIGFTQLGKYIMTPRSVCTERCGPGFRKSPQEGKPACCFSCTPCPENEISNETDMDQCVKCPDLQYANTEKSHCIQRAVTFLAYEAPLGMALACTALCFSALTAAVLGVFVKHRDTPIVKANNRALSYILLISLTFCFLCSLLFIGRPNTATCILQETTFGLVFTVAVSTVLAKTVTVILAFKVAVPGRRMRRWLVSGAPNFIIPSCSLIQLTLCGVWLGTSPPFVDTDTHSEHGHIIITCNKGSVTAFYCALGYLGSLALGTFTVAFLARNLPDTFNEAKFLTFSMLVFCSVWLTFLPVYHSTKGKVMVALEVFSILASSAGLLGCIFAPKCYVILLRPHRSSLRGSREKLHCRSNKPS
ncbi:vomeronasal type-2 receptor 116-like [Urocitellus parryii]